MRHRPLYVHALVLRWRTNAMNGLATIALAWKEFRQLLGITVAISICAILGFFVAGIIENVAPRQNPLEFFYSIVPATLTPLTIAIAGAVIAVGGERQAGNWQWMTTLPVSWFHAFAVKLIITLMMAIGAGAVVFGATVAINSLDSSPLSYGLGFDAYDYRLMLFAVPIALLWSVIMCLCLREPMIAVMVAAAVTLIQGFIKNLVLSEFVSSSAPTDFGIMAIATSIETIVLTVIAVFSFRAGWFNSEPILAGWTTTNVSSEELASQTRWGSWQKPNSIWAQLWQSVQAQIWPVVAMLIITLIAYPLFGFHVETLIGSLAVILPGFLGIFTLAGEQTRRQFRFIADRGLSPRRYLLLRMVVPVLLIAVMTLFVIPFSQWTIRPEEPPAGQWHVFALLWGLGLGIYLAFVFATLTFSNPMLALFAGIAVIFCVGYGIVSPIFAGGWLGLWVTVPLVLLSIAVPFLLVKRWMRYENANLPMISFASALVISLSSGLFYAPMRAYSVPKVEIPAFNAAAPIGVLPSNVPHVYLDHSYYATLLQALETLDHQSPGYSRVIDHMRPLAANVSSSDFAMGMGMAAGEGEDPVVDQGEGLGVSTEPLTTQLSQEDADKILKQKLAILSEKLLAPRDENAAFDDWRYSSNGFNSAEWLTIAIHYAMLKEDREMLKTAIDAYASFIDPRYPVEFSLYNDESFRLLLSSLHELRGTASPEMFSIVFDRLSQNVPNTEVWSNFFVSLTYDNNHQLSQSHPNYSYTNGGYGQGLSSTLLEYATGEHERLCRVMNLKAAMNIKRCTSMINSIAQIHATNRSNETSEQKPFERNIPLPANNLPHYEGLFMASGDANLDLILARYYAQEYGATTFYPMPERASLNLWFYLNLLSAAASGTTVAE